MSRLRHLSRGGRLLVGLVAGGVVFGIASAVQASIPDASGVIHGCYMKSGGSLSVIDSAASCKSGQTSLNWNQKGATGSRGPTGASGTTGPTGPTGPTEGVNATGTGLTLPMTVTNQFLLSSDLDSTFTTATSGKLYLSKPISASLACSSSPTVWWWITLDGTAVPGSVTLAPAGSTPITQTLVGVTVSDVSAGTHTLSVGAMCFSGAAGASVANVYSGGAAIVLGG